MTFSDGPPGESGTEWLALEEPVRTEILARHAAAVRRGDDGYIDPASGLFVFTATYLANRRRCCATGCRHCPYDSAPSGARSPDSG